MILYYKDQQSRCAKQSSFSESTSRFFITGKMNIKYKNLVKTFNGNVAVDIDELNIGEKTYLDLLEITEQARLHSSDYRLTF